MKCQTLFSEKKKKKKKKEKNSNNLSSAEFVRTALKAKQRLLKASKADETEQRMTKTKPHICDNRYGQRRIATEEPY